MGMGCFKVLWCSKVFSKSSAKPICSDLPDDILDKILNEIESLSDFIRFGGVCKCWYRVFSQRKRHRIERYNNEVPLLFIPPAHLIDKPPPKHFSPSHNNVVVLPNQLFHISEKKCYDSKSQVDAPPDGSRWHIMKVLSASYGWLATIFRNEEHSIISLKNPINGTTFCLPPIVDDENWDIMLVVLSCNPSIYPDKCVVAYKSLKQIGFIRVLGKTWNICQEFTMRIFPSILFHKGKLYALNPCSELFAIDCLWEQNDHDKCGFRSCKIVEKTSSSEGEMCHPMHLVESESGELLIVGRRTSPRASCVVMCKLVVRNMKGHWVRIQGLGNGDEALFLNDSGGDNVMCSKSMDLQPDSVYVFKANVVRRIVRLNKEMQQVECIQFCGVWKTDFRYTISEPLWIKQVLP